MIVDPLKSIEPDPSHGSAMVERVDPVIILFAVLTLVTAGPAVALARGDLDPAVALALHMVAVCAGAACAYQISQSDKVAHSDGAWAMVGLLCTACAGPLGALFGVIALAMNNAIQPADLAAWYARLERSGSQDIAATIAGELQDGRALSPNPGDLRNFRLTIESGELADQQALLGLIGLKYHASYDPVLRLALRSPTATVRVQAAAVFTKLKDQNKIRLHQLLAEAAAMAITTHVRTETPSGNSAAALAVVASITEMLASDLIDPAQARAARSAARDLCLAMLATEPDLIDAEVALNRVLYDDGDYEAVIARVAQRIEQAGAENVEIYAAALLRLGRTREYNGIVRPGDRSAIGPPTATVTAEPRSYRHG